MVPPGRVPRMKRPLLEEKSTWNEEECIVSARLRNVTSSRSFHSSSEKNLEMNIVTYTGLINTTPPPPMSESLGADSANLSMMSSIAFEVKDRPVATLKTD